MKQLQIKNYREQMQIIDYQRIKKIKKRVLYLISK